MATNPNTHIKDTPMEFALSEAQKRQIAQNKAMRDQPTDTVTLADQMPDAVAEVPTDVDVDLRALEYLEKRAKMELPDAPPGWRYRWMRVTNAKGEIDAGLMRRASAMQCTPIPASQLDKDMFGVMPGERFADQDFIMLGGQMAMQQPEPWHQAMKSRVEKTKRHQLTAIGEPVTKLATEVQQAGLGKYEVDSDTQETHVGRGRTPKVAD